MFIHDCVFFTHRLCEKALIVKGKMTNKVEMNKDLQSPGFLKWSSNVFPPQRGRKVHLQSLQQSVHLGGSHGSGQVGPSYTHFTDKLFHLPTPVLLRVLPPTALLHKRTNRLAHKTLMVHVYLKKVVK